MSGKDYIFIKEKAGVFVKILHRDITHIGSDKDYCNIYTSTRIFHVLLRIDEFYKHLPSHVFCRCHRCFIVNIDRINEIQNNEIVIGSGRIPISKGKREELLERLNYIYSSYESSKMDK